MEGLDRLLLLLLAAGSQDLVAGAELGQRLQGGVHHVGVVGRTHRLGEHVTDTDGFADGADATTGDDTGTWRGGLEEHLATAEFGDDFVRDGAVDEIHRLERLLGDLAGLLNRVGDFLGLAETETHFAFLVAGDDERGEAEAAATFDDLGTTVDEDDLLGELRAFRLSGLGTIIAAGTTATATITTLATEATAALAAEATTLTWALTARIAVALRSGSRSRSSGLIFWIAHN